MSWGAIISMGLQLILQVLTWANQKKLIDAGRDREIAAGALRVLDNTAAGKIIRDRVRKLDDASANQLWKDMTGV